MVVPILDIGESPWELPFIAFYLLWSMSGGNPIFGALMWISGILALLDWLTP